MRRELQLRQQVIKLLSAIHAVPIESIVGKSGVPDVNTTLGWIEMKWLENWPVRPETPVRFEFRPAQRDWIAERIRRGGRVALLLIVESEWLLTSGANLDRVGYTTRSELCYMCRVWGRIPTASELIEGLVSV